MTNHSAQRWDPFDQLRTVVQALAAIDAATLEQAVAPQVIPFTARGFGRPLQPSGTGSDHHWGSHHLVLGGAVHGGQVYGRFLSLQLGGPDDAGSRAALIPGTALDQCGATLAGRFGVVPLALAKVFRNLANFALAGLGVRA